MHLSLPVSIGAAGSAYSRSVGADADWESDNDAPSQPTLCQEPYDSPGLPFGVTFPGVTHELVDGIVPMLLREEAPRVGEALRSPKQVLRVSTAIRHEQARRLVVLAVQDRARVAAERDETQRRLVLRLHVECPHAVKRVELAVQRVAAVLGCHQLVLVHEGEIVEGIMRVVAQEEQRNVAIIRRTIVVVMATKVDAEDGAIGAAAMQERVFAGNRVGVPGGVEEEGA